MRSSPGHHRRGFTLLELLVVSGSILLLAGLGAIVMGNVLRSAREQATRATIQKVDGMLRQRQEAFQRALERAELDAAVRFTKAFCRNAFPANPVPIDKFLVDNAGERAWEVLARKTYFRSRFPMSFSDVCWLDGSLIGQPGEPGVDDDGNSITDRYPSTFPYYLGTPDPREFGLGVNDDLQPYATLLRDRMTNPQLHQPATESSEMLYLILTAADLFGVPVAGQDEFSTSEVQDTDGDGLLEFVDGWGRPLRFYRWPTRLLRCGEDAFTGDTNMNATTDSAGALAAANPLYANMLIGTLPSLTPQWEAQTGSDKQLLRDPDDGFGLIETQIINRNGSGTNADKDAARLKLELLYHTPSTYHTVLVVSAGADGVLGLYEPVQFDLGSNIFGHLAQPVTLGDPSESPLADNITNRRQ